VPDQRRDIEREVRFDRLAIAGEIFPRPFEGLGEGFRRHFLDLLEHADDPLAIGCLERRQRQRAVAGHDGRDAMFERRARGTVPQHLHVEMGVRIDEARRDDATLRIDGAFRIATDIADGGDPAILHGHVGELSFGTGAIDHKAVADHDIEHHSSSRTFRQGCPASLSMLATPQALINCTAVSGSSTTGPTTPF
jgi:hypothetical protein